MRKVHKERLLGVFGIVLILSTLLLFFLWESFGREALTYEAIIVCRNDVQKGSIIEKDMLGMLKTEKGSLIKDVIRDPDLIIGKRSNTFIPSGIQLSKEFFSDPELVTGEGNNILSVPMEWIYSYPQTIRRGDLVHFYSIARDRTRGGAAENTSAENYSGGTTENTYDSQAEIAVGNEKPLVSVKVAYVKDSSNREVVDVTPGRMDGSAAVSGIEIVISEEKYESLKRAAESGKIFIVMYE